MQQRARFRATSPAADAPLHLFSTAGRWQSFSDDRIKPLGDESGSTRRSASISSYSRRRPRKPAACKGLYQLSKQLRPKAPKRSIHFRDEAGLLLSPSEEMRVLKQYFDDLYQSSAVSQSAWRLTTPFQVTSREAAAALRHKHCPQARSLLFCGRVQNHARGGHQPKPQCSVTAWPSSSSPRIGTVRTSP